MDELRCLQLLCKFDMIAITETHLDKTVPDSALDISGMKLLRLDRKGRKGGGCALYFAEYLQATQRKDLHFDSLEGIWLHVKFPSSTALFAVMYRPPDADHFFRSCQLPFREGMTEVLQHFSDEKFQLRLLY